MKDNAYRRQTKTDAGWMKTLASDPRLCLRLECGGWGGAAVGGNDFRGLIQTEPAVGPLGSVIHRQASFPLCLLPEELDELREIQNGINRRRPRTAELAEWMRESSAVGEHTRAMYKAYAKGEKPYRAGDLPSLGYFSVADVREHAGFVLRRLPDIVARFVEGRVAQARSD
jgi:hypothetical protein